MKTLTFALLALSSTSINVFANSTISANEMTLNKDGQVTFTRAEVGIEERQGVLVNTATTYYSPKVWINGNLKPFFVGSTNGNQFCE